MIRLLVLALAICFSGVLYRMGGSYKYDTLYRDIGCPLVALATLWFLVGLTSSYWWAYLLFFGLSWAALTTYYDELFGYDNFFAHGFGCGLAGFALIMVIPWWIVLARLIICTLGMGLWSRYVERDIPQEIGRGVFFIL